MTPLKPFQLATVEAAFRALTDGRKRVRRFLVADEVGLGKTVVARGVIDRLTAGRTEPLKVVYLCSNGEIAQQNRTKLVDTGGITVGRVTELALRSSIPVLHSYRPRDERLRSFSEYL